MLICCSQELSLNAKVRAALRTEYDIHPDIGSLKSFLVSAIQYRRSGKFRCKNISWNSACEEHSNSTNFAYLGVAVGC